MKLATTTKLSPQQTTSVNPTCSYKILTVTDNLAKKLQLNDEEFVADERPFEVLHLEQETLVMKSTQPS